MPTGEHRHLHLEIRLADGNVGDFTGIASRFNEADAFGDVIQPGAFAESIRTRGSVPLLWSHDPASVIGRVTEMEETRDGLVVRGRMAVGTPKADEVRQLVRGGFVDGLSIGFRTRRARTGRDGQRIVEQIEVFEVSLVAIPAAERARITELRGAAASQEDRMTDQEETAAAAEDAAPEIDTAAIVQEVRSGIAADLSGITRRMDDLERRMQRPVTTPRKEEDREVRAFRSFVRMGAERMPVEEVRDLRVADNAAGGYLAPDQFSAELIKNLVEISPVRAAARVSNISGGSLILPKRTGTTTATWVGENETRPETKPTYGQVEIQADELACYVDVSNRLLEDAAIDIASELAMDFAEEFARAEADAFLNGNGVKQPEGLMTNADVETVPNGHATTIQIDGLIDLFHDLPALYRNRGAWVMNSKTIGAVRKLKDADGQYLWRDSLVEGNPPTLLGRPVVDAAQMPDLEAGATPILFGDFASAYRIVDRVGMSVLRDPYSMSTSGIVRFIARRRTGGRVVLAEAIRKLSMEV